jgi:hypothetical protein
MSSLAQVPKLSSSVRGLGNFTPGSSSWQWFAVVPFGICAAFWFFLQFFRDEKQGGKTAEEFLASILTSLHLAHSADFPEWNYNVRADKRRQWLVREHRKIFLRTFYESVVDRCMLKC